MAAKQPSASTYSMAMPCSCINHALHMHWSFYSLTYVSCIGHGLVTSFFDRCEKYQKHRLPKWLRRSILGGGREPARGMEGKVVHGGGRQPARGMEGTERKPFFSIDPFPKTCIRQDIINDHIDLETFSFDEFNLQFRCKGVEKFYAYRQRAFKVLPK